MKTHFVYLSTALQFDILCISPTWFDIRNYILNINHFYPNIFSLKFSNKLKISILVIKEYREKLLKNWYDETKYNIPFKLMKSELLNLKYWTKCWRSIFVNEDTWVILMNHFIEYRTTQFIGNKQIYLKGCSSFYSYPLYPIYVRTNI